MDADNQKTEMSAYLKAIEEIIECLGEMTAGDSEVPLRIYLVGCAAMHVLTGCRVSDDVQIFFSQPVLVPNDLGASYLSDNGVREYVYFDPGFNPHRCPMSPDYEQRALKTRLAEFRGVEVFALAPIDLAISKLGRFDHDDQADIKALIDYGLLVNASEFTRYANEAIDRLLGSRPILDERVRAVIDWIHNSQRNPEDGREREDLQGLFESLCRHQLDAGARELEQVCARLALSMLEGFTPNVCGLEGASAQRAGYLLEVTANLARRRGLASAFRLHRQAHHLVADINEESDVTFYPIRHPAAYERRAVNHDPLARRWGLRHGAHPVELKYHIESIKLGREKLGR